MTLRHNMPVAPVMLFVLILTAGAQDTQTFSMPHSVMLFAEPYDRLAMVGPGANDLLRPPVDVKANSGYFVRPSIGPNGDLVSWGFVVANDDTRDRLVRFAVGVYSRTTRQWKTYGEFDLVTATSFSPDGSKIAITAESRGRNSSELSVLDLKTGKISRIAYIAGVQPSWSPDGKKLAVNILRGEKTPAIAIVDLDSGRTNMIAEGGAPAWSPSGEWIAYLAVGGNKCVLVHPDGTGSRILENATGTLLTYRRFGYAIVWSPDGKQLLLNKLTNELGRLDVVLVDIETGRSTIKVKNGLPVFGWVSRVNQ